MRSDERRSRTRGSCLRRTGRFLRRAPLPRSHRSSPSPPWHAAAQTHRPDRGNRSNSKKRGKKSALGALTARRSPNPQPHGHPGVPPAPREGSWTGQGNPRVLMFGGFSNPPDASRKYAAGRHFPEPSEGHQPPGGTLAKRVPEVLWPKSDSRLAPKAQGCSSRCRELVARLGPQC